MAFVCRCAFKQSFIHSFYKFIQLIHVYSGNFNAIYWENTFKCNQSIHCVQVICYFVYFQITSLLSDIGGQLGFWIGLSIIGCVEVIELLVDLAILACLGVFGCGRSRTGGKTSPVMPYTTGGDSSKDADIKAKLGYRGTTIVHK